MAASWLLFKSVMQSIPNSDHQVSIIILTGIPDVYFLLSI